MTASMELGAAGGGEVERDGIRGRRSRVSMAWTEPRIGCSVKKRLPVQGPLKARFTTG